MVKMAGNGVLGAVGQGRAALLSGFEMAWINQASQRVTFSEMFRAYFLPGLAAIGAFLIDIIQTF
jgi:hypothetical protein